MICRIVLLLFVIPFVIQCKKEEIHVQVPAFHLAEQDSGWKAVPFHNEFSLDSLELQFQYSDFAKVIDTIKDVHEASGLAASHRNPGMLWVHNDSGNDPVLFLLDAKTGKLRASYKLGKTSNTDWEDICTGPGPEAGKHYIYIGDIGDNNSSHKTGKIYRLEEPQYLPVHEGKQIEWNIQPDVIEFVYPDGARDAECLMTDPLTKDLLVVSKREDAVRLYVATYPQKTGMSDTLLFAGSFSMSFVTGGDISADGRKVILKSYTEIVGWERKDNESLHQCLKRAPKRMPYNPGEIQGEAICWEAENKGYFTLSEKTFGIEPVLYFYEQK